MYNHPHHIRNVFFPLEGWYILLQSSYSPKIVSKMSVSLTKADHVGSHLSLFLLKLVSTP